MDVLNQNFPRFVDRIRGGSSTTPLFSTAPSPSQAPIVVATKDSNNNKQLGEILKLMNALNSKMDAISKSVEVKFADTNEKIAQLSMEIKTIKG